MSRLQRVVDGAGKADVWTEDADGVRHRVSLLAFDGPLPGVGDWLVVHSGYALGPVDPVEASEAVAALRAAPGNEGGEAGADHR